jgi:hypothetical protein
MRREKKVSKMKINIMFLFSVFFGCVLCMRKMFFQKEKCLFIRRLPSGGKKRMKKRRRIKKKKRYHAQSKKKEMNDYTQDNNEQNRTENRERKTLNAQEKI